MTTIVKICLANCYNLFVASHTYVPAYIQDFVFHMVCKISCCLQTRNELNRIINNDYLNKFSNQYQYISV